jgi:hypothetical protein
MYVNMRVNENMHTKGRADPAHERVARLTVAIVLSMSYACGSVSGTTVTFSEGMLSDFSSLPSEHGEQAVLLANGDCA